MATRTNSIRFRLTFLFLVLTTLLLVVTSRALYVGYNDIKNTNGDKLRNELSNTLNTVAGIQASERGVGNTVIGGDKEMLDQAKELAKKGDLYVWSAIKIAEELINKGFANPDLALKLKEWKLKHNNLIIERGFLETGETSPEKWFSVTTNNILVEFDIQDAILTPLEKDDSNFYYNSILRPNVAILAEYAGRERAIIGNLLASGLLLSPEQLNTLQNYRSHVDKSLRQILSLKSDVNSPPRLKTAVQNFENLFLGSYEKIRTKIYSISETINKRTEGIQPEFEKNEAVILEKINKSQGLIRKLANNKQLKEQIIKINERGEIPQKTLPTKTDYAFENLFALQRDYLQARYIDNNGQEQLRINFTGDKTTIVTGDELQNKKDKSYFKETMKLKEGEIYISPLNLNLEFGEVVTPYQPVMRFTTPIFIEGTRQGMVVLNRDASHIFHLLPINTFMVDQDGFYLHHPNPKEKWGMVKSLGRVNANINNEFPYLTNYLVSKKPHKIITKNQSHIIRPIQYNSQNLENYWVLVNTYGASNYPLDGPDWIAKSSEAINSALAISNLIGEMAISESDNKKQNSIINMVGLLSFLIILMGLLVYFFKVLSVVIKKTEVISNEINLISSGDLSRRVGFVKNINNSTQIGDEIDNIAININKMATNIETQQLEVSRSKEQAEMANRSKTEFLAMMSHDLRTPLNAIIGFSDMMKTELMGPIENKNYKDYVEHINTSGELLLNLINVILDISKIESGKLELNEEAVDINEFFNNLITSLNFQANKFNITIENTSGQNLPNLFCDKVALTQVANNLLSNAIKFSQENSKIEVNISLTAKNTFIIKVVDKGIGMSKDEIKLALEPFIQVDSKKARKHDGTGLGLHISKLLIQSHEGALIIESEVDKGTTITLTFPPERTKLPK